MMRDPMEVAKPWDETDADYRQRVSLGDREDRQANLVTVYQPLRQTPGPLDLTLWTLSREADALTLGLSLGAFKPTRAQRASVTTIIEQLQRAESLAIEQGT